MRRKSTRFLALSTLTLLLGLLAALNQTQGHAHAASPTRRDHRL